ncbi:MAG: hypothetical protein A2958_02345 [Candidatus Levybacteria bacterium RIFCSPLOWO2_01_FULL_38_13]|nr:MAG: hypothetical protein A2629_03975 [Candidatus Levybacteria bacterium RIFCSPHIGHO2_01_FULL_41_15]OGH35090.1 MAG: hypothetical protein A2958_02345 [Candidatus Levybacteria bacterium RIFCSPLOWO2_01_FULL_38_13]
MSKKGGVLSLEEALETGVSMAKKSAKAVVGAASDAGKAAGSQITGVQDKDTQDIVNSLYAESEKEKDKSQRVEVQGSNDQPDNTPEGLEKKKKLAQLRQQLHNEVYYDPLVNPSKPKQEERPAEKVEKEKQEEMIGLQEKKKKEPPPLIQRQKTRIERLPGAG